MLELFIKVTILAFLGIMLISFIGWAFWKVVIACGIAAVVVGIFYLVQWWNSR
jgi:hypothetical protein